MKTKLLLGLALVLGGGWFASAQTNVLPAFYVHFGAEGDRFLSTRIHLGEPIFVGAGDYWDLKGDVELRGTNFFGGLLGGTGQQSQFYRGLMVLEKPCFAQGGAASGGAGPRCWFVLSTNSDSRPILERIRMEFGFTNRPVNPVQVRMDSISVFSNMPPRNNNLFVNPDTGLPQSPMLIDPTTGLPLPPKRDNQSFKKQIFDILTECQKIKPGMTRAELLKTFTTEGGLSSARHRSFVYRGCPYIKVDVEFTLPEPGQVALEERPTDIISNISKPYLEWSIND